ncbi:MAG: class F sortase [bacterium]|nr:class F sortase [bacterium]
MIIVVTAGFALVIAFLLYRAPQSPIQNGLLPLLGQKRDATVRLPIRLKIPQINIDAAIEYVGVASDGTMDVPKGPNDVAWFELGPRPGEQGSAVIAGHYGWKNNIPAAFDAVSTLQKGNKIYVEDDTGVTIVFVVRETRLFDPKADASSIFESSDGKAHLNLITCEGVWDAVSKSYSKRLVVFTDRE